jgi:predicted site-specific integrase-resolvase
MRPAQVEQHLTPAEVAERLRLQRNAVARLFRPGAIWPIVRLNSRVIRVPASSVARFLSGCTWEPKAIR